MGKSGPCGHCGVTSTPLWRNGPPDKPVLCNACGSRWRTRGNLTNYLPASLGGSGHGGGYYARGSKSAWCKSSKENFRGHSNSSFVVKAAQPKQVSASSTHLWRGEHLHNEVPPWEGHDHDIGGGEDDFGFTAKRPRLHTFYSHCDENVSDVAVDVEAKSSSFSMPVTLVGSPENIARMRRCDDVLEIDDRDHFTDHSPGQNGIGSVSISIPSRKRSSTARLRAAPKKTWAHISSLTTGFNEDAANHGMHGMQAGDGVTLAMPNPASQTVLVQGLGLCSVVTNPASNPLSVILPTREMVGATAEAGDVPGHGFTRTGESPVQAGRVDELEGNDSEHFTRIAHANAVRNTRAICAVDSGGEELGSGDGLARDAATAMAGAKGADSEGASVRSGQAESNGGGEGSERAKQQHKKSKKLDMSKGWQLERRSRPKKVALLDDFPYNKRDVLSSCYSPLAFLEMRDIVNLDIFTKAFSPREQQDLMKLLPADDVVDRRSLADMFSSSQFEAALLNLQQLLSEGMFDSSEMGPSARVFEHYQKLLTGVDLTSSGWMEGVTQLYKRNRRRGQTTDSGKDEIDDAWMASEMAAFAERRASSHKAREGSSHKAHLRPCADIAPPEESAVNDRCLRSADSAVSSSNSREASRWNNVASGACQREDAVMDGYGVLEPVGAGGGQTPPPTKDPNMAAACAAPPDSSLLGVQGMGMGPRYWSTQWQRVDPVGNGRCMVSSYGSGTGTATCEPASGNVGNRPGDGAAESAGCVSVVSYAHGSGAKGMSFANSQMGMYGNRGWFKTPVVCDQDMLMRASSTVVQNGGVHVGDGLGGGSMWDSSASVLDADRYVAIPVPSAVASVSVASPVAVPVPVPDFIRVVETAEDSFTRPRSAKAERHSYGGHSRSCREECPGSCSGLAAPLAASPVPAFTPVMNGAGTALDALLYNGVVRVVGSSERPDGGGGADCGRRQVAASGVSKSYATAGPPSPTCNGADHGMEYTMHADSRKLSYAQALPVMHGRDMLIVPNAGAYPTMLMTSDGWQMYTDPMWENVLWANQGCAGQDRRLLNGAVLYQSQIP